MYTLADVYKTFPSGCTEDYKILRAFEMGKQEGGAKVKELEAQIEKMKSDVLSLIKDRMNDDIDQNIIERLAEKWEIKEK